MAAAVANFGFHAFDFLMSMDQQLLSANFVWSNPVDRASKIRRAVLAVHQYEVFAEEQDVRWRFRNAVAAEDITGWEFAGYLATVSAVDTPIQTVVLGSGIEVMSTPEGIIDVSLSIREDDGVPIGYYVFSLYRTDLQRELAKVSFEIGPTGIDES